MKLAAPPHLTNPRYYIHYVRHVSPSAETTLPPTAVPLAEQAFIEQLYRLLHITPDNHQEAPTPTATLPIMRSSSSNKVMLEGASSHLHVTLRRRRPHSIRRQQPHGGQQPHGAGSPRHVSPALSLSLILSLISLIFHQTRYTGEPTTTRRRRRLHISARPPSAAPSAELPPPRRSHIPPPRNSNFK